MKKRKTKTKSIKNKALLQTPKGMKDVIGNEFYRRQGFFEKAQEISVYYGFDPIETPIIEYEEIFTKGVGDNTDIVEKELYRLKTGRKENLVLRPEYTSGIMRSYIEHGMQSEPQPLYFYSYGPLFRHDKPQAGRYRQLTQFNLEILGKDKSVLDAMIIEIACTILKEAEIKNLVVKINSLGDADSRKEYEKELVAFYRKNINKLAAKDRQRVRTNPIRILDSKESKTIAVNTDAPQCLNYLNTVSKKHFKEVLEYLDQSGIDYEIDHSLVRGLDYYAHTVFEFFAQIENTAENNNKEKNEKNSKILALGGGGRYNTLAETLGHKKNVPGVGCALGIERILEITQNELNPKIIKKPKIYFIQIGFEAKLKSFKIIEILRNKKIPIKHSLSRDTLSKQLGIAESLEIPYTIIFGQKEALEETVIIRNMKTRSQKTVKISDLGSQLKKL